MWEKEPKYLLYYNNKYAQVMLDKKNPLAEELSTINIQRAFKTFFDQELLFELHRLWYKINESPKYSVPEDIVKGWEDSLLALSQNLLEKMQYVLIAWLSEHYYKSPKLMWEKRFEYTEVLISDVASKYLPTLYEYGNFFIRDFEAKKLEPYLKNDFIDWYISYVLRGNLNSFFHRIFYIMEGDNVIDPTKEWIEEEIFKFNNDPKYKERIFKFFIEEGFKSWEEFLMSIDVNLSTQSSSAPKKLFLDYVLDNHSEWIKTIDKSKGSSSDQSFKVISDLVEKQAIRNKAALATNDYNAKVTAISLTLNLEHNFGNLISDHSGNNFSEKLLDELSNMDMEEEDNELRRLGVDINSVYDELGKPSYKDEFDLQHDYYKNKEKERVKRILDNNPDKSVKELGPILTPNRGASNDWRNIFLALYRRNK